MKCPVCGCESFYAKDPQDSYETCALEIGPDGRASCADPEAEIEVGGDIEIYCDRCAWHGRPAPGAGAR